MFDDPHTAAARSGPLVGRRGPLVGRVAKRRDHHRAMLVVAALACLGCPAPLRPGDADTPTDAIADAFDGERAHATLSAWLGRTRALGDPARVHTLDALADELLARGAARIERIDHVGRLPGEPTAYPLQTIVGHFGPTDRRFVLATHFDTRPWADEDPDATRHGDPVPGANDGTSGLAVVLELASVLPERLPAGVGFSVVLLDGEELGRPGDLSAYCAGSRDLARRLAAGLHPELARAELGIVLDMVGDADLQLLPEASSAAIHPALVDHIWSTAHDLGVTAFDATSTGPTTLDDHTFLTEAGIPSVLVIDRDYAAWHRVDDTIARVSAGSLDAVGTVVLESIVRWYAR